MSAALKLNSSVGDDRSGDSGVVPKKRARDFWEDSSSADDDTRGVSKATAPKPKKARKQRVNLYPGGKGMKFLCTPPEMVDVAIEGVVKIHPKIIKAVATPGVVAGLTVYVNNRLTISLDALCDTSGDKKWKLEVTLKTSNSVENAATFPLTAGVVSDENQMRNDSPIIPAGILRELKLAPEEAEMMPVVNWLYSFYGMTTDTSGDVFLLLSVNVLHELGFILGSDKEARITPILDALATIDPENIRGYTDATPKLLGLTSLPDVPGSVIYNPLRYTPAKNTVIAVKEGYILKALANYTSTRARAMSGLLARCFEHFMKKKAADHAREVGPEEFKKTVVKPAGEGFMGYIEQRAVELEKELIKIKGDLGQSHLETKREHLERLKTEIAFDEEQEKHEDTKRSERLAILDKQTLENQFELHKAVNHPTQTMTHSGNNQPRVGCVVLKATLASEEEKSELLKLSGERAVEDIAGWDNGTRELKDINTDFAVLLTSHVSDRTSSRERRTTLAHCYRGAKTQACARNYTQTQKAVLTLMGGHNVITFRSVFREEMITFGGKRTNTLFAIPAGKSAQVAKALKERCGSGFAAGVYDGRVLFINEKIMSCMPQEDAETCRKIIKTLTGEED